MKKNVFKIVLIAVVALCVILTAIHLIYDIIAYQHCSIIYFISKELW